MPQPGGSRIIEGVEVIRTGSAGGEFGGVMKRKRRVFGDGVRIRGFRMRTF
jgi:hypothetical protein